MTVTAPAPAAAPPAPSLGPVHAFDEFGPLREVIVGRIDGGQLPTVDDRSRWLNLYPDQPTPSAMPTGPFSDRVVEETSEDLDDLAGVLAQAGVQVHRPAPVDHTAGFSTPDWSADGFYSYCPRDLVLVAGTTLIETPSPMRARYHETRALAPLFSKKMGAGAAWIAAPKPRLADGLYRLNGDGRPVLGEAEPAFEAANVLRCGRDLFYQVSGSGNRAGLLWLQRTLDALGRGFRVHALEGLYEGTHLDSTISLLRPGLVLLNPARVRPDQIPDLLRGWDVLWCPPMAPAATTGTELSSEWIGMNLLMAAPDLAVVDADQTALIRALERRRIRVAPVRLRHARTLGGGVHCTTLDLVRDNPAVDYFS